MMRVNSMECTISYPQGFDLTGWGNKSKSISNTTSSVKNTTYTTVRHRCELFDILTASSLLESRLEWLLGTGIHQDGPGYMPTADTMTLLSRHLGKVMFLVPRSSSTTSQNGKRRRPILASIAYYPLGRRKKGQSEGPHMDRRTAHGPLPAPNSAGAGTHVQLPDRTKATGKRSPLHEPAPLPILAGCRRLSDRSALAASSCRMRRPAGACHRPSPPPPAGRTWRRPARRVSGTRRGGLP